jgi:hypothetical protein
MQAIFRFGNSEEIEVWNDAAGVNLYRRKGVTKIEDGLRHVDEEHTISLSKSQARSLASALMGAASEV